MVPVWIWAKIKRFRCIFCRVSHPRQKFQEKPKDLVAKSTRGFKKSTFWSCWDNFSALGSIITILNSAFLDSLGPELDLQSYINYNSNEISLWNVWFWKVFSTWSSLINISFIFVLKIPVVLKDKEKLHMINWLRVKLACVQFCNVSFVSPKTTFSNHFFYKTLIIPKFVALNKITLRTEITALSIHIPVPKLANMPTTI